MTAQIISFTDHYNVRRLPIWQLQQVRDLCRDHKRTYKLTEHEEARYRIVLRELNRRKELNNARQQSKRV